MPTLHIIVGVDESLVDAPCLRGEQTTDPGVTHIVEKRAQLVSCLGS